MSVLTTWLLTLLLSIADRCFWRCNNWNTLHRQWDTTPLKMNSHWHWSRMLFDPSEEMSACLAHIAVFIAWTRILYTTLLFRGISTTGFCEGSADFSLQVVKMILLWALIRVNDSLNFLKTFPLYWTNISFSPFLLLFFLFLDKH